MLNGTIMSSSKTLNFWMVSKTPRFDHQKRGVFRLNFHLLIGV